MFFIVYEKGEPHVVHAVSHEPKSLVDLEAMAEDDAAFMQLSRRRVRSVRWAIFVLFVFLMGAICFS